MDVGELTWIASHASVLGFGKHLTAAPPYFTIRKGRGSLGDDQNKTRSNE